MTGVRRHTSARLGVTVALLASVAVAPALPASAAVPVPGQYIFVQTPNRQHYYLYAANATTGTKRRISTQQAVGRPSFSPDGAKIVFAGPYGNDDSHGRYSIYTVNRDGTGTRRVTTAKFAHLDPVWSPNGTTIAFTRDLKGNSESSCCTLALVKPDGSSFRAVPNTYKGSFPAWSPDSRKLAFVKPDGLYVINTSGTGSKRLVAGRITTPEWSPDGRTIAFVQRIDSTHSRLRVVPSGGGTPTTRWAPSGHVESPVWGVDGRTLHVVFHRGIGDWARYSSAIWRVPPSGSPAKQLDPAAHVFYLDYHDLLPKAGATGFGLVTPTAEGLMWRRTDTAGVPATEPLASAFGAAGDVPVVGDWNGDGTQQRGFVRTEGGALHWDLEGGGTGAFEFGLPGDIPVVGDWDGDGVDSPGVVRIVDGRLQWRLRSGNGATATQLVRTYGSVVNGVPDVPLAGDWNADGVTTVGVARQSGGALRWLLSNASTTAASVPDVSFDYGLATDRPLVGDWDGDRDETPGVTRANADGSLQWHVRNSASAGTSSATFVWGVSSDVPVTGDWDGK
jgi:hypothetical protein